MSRRAPRTLHENLDFTLGLHLLDELLQLLLALALLEEALDLAADLGQRRRARTAPLDHLDDVKAERRFDQAGECARLGGECGLLERRRHLSLAEEPEIAAVLGAAGILRLGARDRGEVAAAADLLQDRLRPRSHRRALLGG